MGSDSSLVLRHNSKRITINSTFVSSKIIDKAPKTSTCKAGWHCVGGGEKTNVVHKLSSWIAAHPTKPQLQRLSLDFFERDSPAEGHRLDSYVHDPLLGDFWRRRLLYQYVFLTNCFRRFLPPVRTQGLANLQLSIGRRCASRFHIWMLQLDVDSKPLVLDLPPERIRSSKETKANPVNTFSENIQALFLIATSWNEKSIESHYSYCKTNQNSSHKKTQQNADHLSMLHIANSRGIVVLEEPTNGVF